MKEKIIENKQIIMLVLSILLIIIGATYAWFTWVSTDNTNLNLTIGEIAEIVYTNGDTISATNIGPVLDINDGEATSFSFKKRASGLLKTYIYITPTTLPDELKEESFKIALLKSSDGASYTKVIETSTVDKTLDTEFLLGTDVSELSITYYKVVIYIDGNMENPNTMMGKSFVATIRVDADNVPNANTPVLADGMIPIKYDGTDWVKADSTNTNNNWYDYYNKMWANAVMVTNETRDTYMNATAGTTVSEEDILAYYVWIPRYKYQLFNVDSTTMDPIEIQVEFEDGIPTKSSGTANGEWLTHPAFTFGTDELSGIWVGKFSTTGSAETPTIKPNIGMLTNQNVSTQFTTSQKFGTTIYLTSTGVSQVDAHMMKNIEWGAVAYLKQSKYGLGTTDIGWNNYDSRPYLTGCGAASGSEYSTTCNAYNTTDGMSASTTGNITGVYDMSAYTGTYVMGVIQDNTGTNTPMSGYSSSSNSGFTGKVYDSGNFTQYSGVSFPNSKYYDLYAYGTSHTDYTRRILGDATGEVHGWYGDYAYFVFSLNPWFVRGVGSSSDPTLAGVFTFGGDLGRPDPLLAFRSVLVPIQ